MNDTIKPIVNALAGPVRVMLMATFILLAKMGWITWATPEAMHAQVNAIMDFLVVAAPSAYALWVFFQALRANKPETIIAKAAEVIKPTGGVIETTPELARAIPAINVIAQRL